MSYPPHQLRPIRIIIINLPFFLVFSYQVDSRATQKVLYNVPVPITCCNMEWSGLGVISKLQKEMLYRRNVFPYRTPMLDMHSSMRQDTTLSSPYLLTHNRVINVIIIIIIIIITSKHSAKVPIHQYQVHWDQAVYPEKDMLWYHQHYLHMKTCAMEIRPPSLHYKAIQHTIIVACIAMCISTCPLAAVDFSFLCIHNLELPYQNTHSLCIFQAAKWGRGMLTRWSNGILLCPWISNQSQIKDYQQTCRLSLLQISSNILQMTH